MLTVTLSSSLYLYIVFKKYFKCKPNLKALADLNPIEHIKDKKEMITSLSILFVVILIVVFKEAITSYT
jgi:Na+/H+ antiporter NhaD/arsenite permease-like protein